MSSIANTLLDVQHLDKRFGEIQALRDVNFAIGAGSVVGLIGPNGAGKTTLLECIAGLTPPDSGVVKTTGLFYLPDDVLPWQQQSVDWSLRFFEGLHQGKGIARRQLIEELQLSEQLDKQVGVLSRGQRKRFLVALAFLSGQALLLLDEPFEGLDVRQVQHIAEFLRRQVDSGCTLLLSIHQLVDATRVCDRLLLLSNGEIVGDGTMSTLRASAGLPDASLEEVFLALT